MPPEKSVVGEGLIIIARGVEVHFHNAVDVPRRRHKTRSIDAKPPRYRRANLLDVKVFALYFRRFDDFKRERFEVFFVFDVESKSARLAHQYALLQPHFAQYACNQVVVVPKILPIMFLMQIHNIIIFRKDDNFSANMQLFAEKSSANGNYINIAI